MHDSECDRVRLLSRDLFILQSALSFDGDGFENSIRKESVRVRLSSFFLKIKRLSQQSTPFLTVERDKYGLVTALVLNILLNNIAGYDRLSHTINQGSRVGVKCPH